MQRLALREVVPLPAPACFALIADVAAYPRFLPHCADARILSTAASGATTTTTAQLTIAFMALSVKYTSLVEAIHPHTVRARAVSFDVFDTLDTEWRFSPVPPSLLLQSTTHRNNLASVLASRHSPYQQPPPPPPPPRPTHTQVDFSIAFKFNNPIYNATARFFLNTMARDMMAAFHARASDLNRV